MLFRALFDMRQHLFDIYVKASADFKPEEDEFKAAGKLGENTTILESRGLFGEEKPRHISSAGGLVMRRHWHSQMEKGSYLVMAWPPLSGICLFVAFLWPL
jgi:hypothetical protein